MADLISTLEALTAEQQQLLKEIIRYGSMGDTDYEFYQDGHVTTKHAWFYTTNCMYDKSPFTSRKRSAMLNAIYNKLCTKFFDGYMGSGKSGVGQYMSHHKNWWGKGTGSVLFFEYDNCDILDEWAKQ